MVLAIEFDFENKREGQLPVERVCEACEQERYCWIDFDESEISDAEQLLLKLGVLPDTVEAIISQDPRTQFNIYPECLQFTLLEARFDDGEFRTAPVKVVLGGRFMVTIHNGEIEFLKHMLLTYREGFYTAALSPGFLLFELADHVTHVYRDTLSYFSEQIDKVEEQLIRETDDQIFIRASELIRSLLKYRKIIVSSREIIHELATRRSPYVRETTQPFLEKKAALLERLGNDATTEREVLSECLNLYMGIVSYHTNKVVTRLTSISTIFLPLAFLVGLYGMNFKFMPELEWEYGYLGFWIIAGVLVCVLLFLMKRNKWL